MPGDRTRDDDVDVDHDNVHHGDVDDHDHVDDHDDVDVDHDDVDDYDVDHDDEVNAHDVFGDD